MSQPLNRASAITLSCLLLVAACAAPRSHFPLQSYVPIGRDVQPLGDLQLSNAQMRLGALEGEMKLQYVGLMPETAGTDLAGASVYRIKNSAQYFKKNAGKSSYCTEPPRWVALNSETGAPAWSNEIWVGLLTLEDWSKFTPVANRYCAGGAYVRAPR